MIRSKGMMLFLIPVFAVKGRKLRPRDVRLKQTGDNRLLGIMDCDVSARILLS